MAEKSSTKTSWFPVQFLIGNNRCLEFTEGNFGLPKKINVFSPQKINRINNLVSFWTNTLEEAEQRFKTPRRNFVFNCDLISLAAEPWRWSNNIIRLATSYNKQSFSQLHTYSSLYYLAWIRLKPDLSH